MAENNDFVKQFGISGDNPAVAPDYVKKEGERIMDALRKAQPSFVRNPPGQNITVAGSPSAAIQGRFGASGLEFEQKKWNQAGVKRTRADIFTPPEAEPEQQATGESVPKIAFIVSNATVFEGDPPVESNKVLVKDGKINGNYPTGMPSNDTYTIDLADPADSLIYAGITFDPTTLAINSRFLGVSDSANFPESRVESDTSGFIYWLLAFTYFDVDGNFKVVNSRVGDINFSFSYGASGGAPALLPVDSAPGWLDLSLM